MEPLVSAPGPTATFTPALNRWLVFSGQDQLDLLLEQYIHSLYDQFLNHPLKPDLSPDQLSQLEGYDWYRASLTQGLNVEELADLVTNWLMAVQQMSDLPLDQPQQP
uniref:Uncharacterized protein n=1 Tax=Cyanothece sp. (strain PCC 7425 / ATCC 29141) TaxID=395961 RepID=B8HYB5_CYAP4